MVSGLFGFSHINNLGFPEHQNLGSGAHVVIGPTRLYINFKTITRAKHIYAGRVSSTTPDTRVCPFARVRAESASIQRKTVTSTNTISEIICPDTHIFNNEREGVGTRSQLRIRSPVGFGYRITKLRIARYSVFALCLVSPAHTYLRSRVAVAEPKLCLLTNSAIQFLHKPKMCQGRTTWGKLSCYFFARRTRETQQMPSCNYSNSTCDFD